MGTVTVYRALSLHRSGRLYGNHQVRAFGRETRDRRCDAVLGIVEESV